MFIDWMAAPAVPLTRLSTARDDDDAVRGAVDRESEESGVGAHHVGGARELARREQLDEAPRRRRRLPTLARISVVGRLPGRSGAELVARMPRAIGTMTGVNEMRMPRSALDRPRLRTRRPPDSARRRCTRIRCRIGSPHPRRGESLADLGDVPVRAAHRVWIRRAEDLAREEVRLEALARAARADRENGDDVGRVDHAGGDARRETEAHGARVAAGCRDAAWRRRDASRCLVPPTGSSGTPYVHGSWKSPP